SGWPADAVAARAAPVPNCAAPALRAPSFLARASKSSGGGPGGMSATFVRTASGPTTDTFSPSTSMTIFMHVFLGKYGKSPFKRQRLRGEVFDGDPIGTLRLIGSLHGYIPVDAWRADR